MTLQPIVEYAIYHGIKVKQQGGTVRIESLLEDMDTTMAHCAPMTPERMAERPFWRRAMGTVLRLFAMWM